MIFFQWLNTNKRVNVRNEAHKTTQGLGLFTMNVILWKK
jgi:hypothetical protein